MSPPTDRVPIDPAALAENAEAVRRLARSLVGEARADDVSQEALRTAIERPPPAGFAPFAWIAGIAKNVARSTARGDRRRRAREEAVARPDASPSTADAVARLEERRRVVEAVLALPEPHRSAVALRWFDDLPPREVARRQGVPVETARTRLKRALQLLRADLERRHGGDQRRSLGALFVLAYPRGRGALVPWGGLAVGTSTKVGIAAACVALLGIATYVGVRAGGAREGTGTEVAGTGMDAPSHAGLAAAPAKPAATPKSDEVPAGAQVRGRVLTRAGLPVAGARVVVESADRPGGASPAADAPSTAADGTFQAAAPTGVIALRVVVSADRFAPATAQARAGIPVDIRLDPMGAAHLVLLDADTDAPVAGATVEWAVASAGSEWSEHYTADEKGRVTVPDPGPGDWAGERTAASVSIAAPGYTVTRRSLDEWTLRGSTRERPSEIHLSRGAPLRVRVLDRETTKPVAGARVTGWCGEGVPVGAGMSYRVPRSAFASLGEATTDAEGVAGLAGPEPGRDVIVLADAQGRVGATASMGRAPSRPGGRGDSVEPWTVLLRPTVSLRGRVVDEQGAPIAGAHVEGPWIALFSVDPANDRFRLAAFPPAEIFDALAATTEPDGRFELRWIAFRAAPGKPESASVSAYAAGRRYVTVDVPAPPAGETPGDVEIRLPPYEKALTFHVRDESGRPVSGALVMRLRSFPAARTGPDGIARLYLGTSGTQELLLVRVAAPGFATAEVPANGPGAPQTFDVVLHPGRALDVRVLDPAGRPVAALVQVWSDAPPGPRLPPRFVPDARRLADTVTDAEGRTRIDALPKGLVVVVARSSADPVKNAARAEVPPDAESCEVRLPAAEPDPSVGSTIEAEVLDRDGVPIPRYRAYLEGDAIPYVPVFAGRRLRFRGVAPGDYTIVVSVDGEPVQIRRRVSVRAGEDVLDLRLQQQTPAVLVGTLQRPEGKVAGRLRVAAVEKGPRGGERVSAVASGGAFTLEGIPPGDYVLRVSETSPVEGAVPLRAAAGDFTVAEGDRVTRTFDLVAGTRLWLRLDDPRFAESMDGKAAKEDDPRWAASRSSSVSVWDDAGRHLWVGLLENGRRAVPIPLAPGTYRVKAQSGLGGFRGEVRVERPGDVQLEIRLNPDETD